jgi:hypothetical protein
MIHEFTLKNGKSGTIEIDDMLIDIKGEDWAEQYVKEYIAKLEKESESQE